MKPYFSRARLAALFGAVALSLAGILTPVHAQIATTVGVSDRLIGQVTNLIGSPTRPDGFSLQLGTSSVDLHVAPNRVTLRPLSGEAEVEGLANGDYALVNVRRVKRAWMVVRITFDVQPFAPLRQISGTLLRISPDGMRAVLRLDPTHTLLFRVTRQTRLRLDGRFTDPLTGLTKGSAVQGLLLRVNGVWAAIDLDARSQGPLFSARLYS